MRERLVYALGAAVIVALLLVPPWCVPGSPDRLQCFYVGHAWRLSYLDRYEGSEPTYIKVGIHLDAELLAAEILGVAAITLLLAKALK